jgi:imidazolonepropionase
MPLLLSNARLITPDQSKRRADGSLAGAHMRSLLSLANADVLCIDGRISRIAPHNTLTNIPSNTHVLDCAGRVLLPGFVDCHTHACFAGERLSEWEQKLAGVAYLDILKAGGGIHSTVRATRAASQAELQSLLQSRITQMLAHGSTTIEIKTGYGLLADAELHMLSAILLSRDHFAKQHNLDIIPTALLAHALDSSLSPEQFVQQVITVALPACAKRASQQSVSMHQFAIDCYIENGAWNLEQCAQLFAAAHALGMRLRAHADQFTSQGLVQASIAASKHQPSPLPAPLHTIDHLEATDASTLEALASTSTIAVALPCAGFHTDQRYMNARPFIDAGGALAIATNYNPGSAPCFAMPMAIALAVRQNKLTIAEALTAATANAAAALNLPDRGCIAESQRADLILLHTKDERSLAYEFGGNPIAQTIVAGSIINTTH